MEGCRDVVPDPVTNLRLDRLSVTAAHASWTDVTAATTYELVEDRRPGGPFATVTATAASGVAGTDLLLPPDPLVFYLVRAVNGCAIGPLR